MATYNATFRDTPAESEDHGRGGQRIRETRDEVRKRFGTEHNVGDSTIAAGYTDDGRHTPGSAVAFRGANVPTALLRPDATSSTGSPPSGPASLVATLGVADIGRLWVDTSGAADVLRYLDDTTTTPDVWPSVHGYNNWLINGSFQVWQRSSAATISCVAAANTFTADHWYVNPTGAVTTVERSAAPGWTAPQRSTYAFRLNGVLLLTQFVLGTRIESVNVPRLRVNGDVNFSMRVRNAGTGVSITPTLRVATADALNNFTVVTVQATNAFTAVANNAEAYLNFTFDTAAYPNNFGLQLEVTFVGSAAIAAGQVYVGEVILEWGKSRSHFVEPEFSSEFEQCERYYEKTFNYTTTPADFVSQAGAVLCYGDTSVNTTGVGLLGSWFFKVHKWSNAYTLNWYNPTPGAASAGRFHNLTTGLQSTANYTGTHLVGLAGVDSRGVGSMSISNSANTAASDQGRGLMIHIVCNSELL